MALRPPYSTRFLAGALASGASSPYYSVPAGRVAIVSDVLAIPSGAGPVYGFWGLPGTSYFGRIALLTSDAQYHWSGHQVFNQGEDIFVLSTSGAIYYAVSGYLLTI